MSWTSPQSYKGPLGNCTSTPLQFLGWESLSYMISECCHTPTIHHFFSLNVFCKGADMDVCLTNYGHCNYISGKHACIFYDEVCLFLTAVLLKCKSMSLYCTAIHRLCCWTKEVLLWTWCKWFVYCMYPFFRIPSIMSCSTTASTARRWTTSCTRVTSLRRPRRLHPAAWWPKSKALSVSTSQSYTLKLLKLSQLFICVIWRFFTWDQFCSCVLWRQN